MRKLDWYIFKKFVGTFVFAISLLIVIVIVFDVSENVDSFINNHASFKEVVFHYYIPFIPYFINLFIFLFSFISVIFFTSKMAGHTEIIAILSSGISFRRFLYPYFLAAMLLAVVSFYLGNFMIPKNDIVRRKFKDTYMEKLTRNTSQNIHVQIEKNAYIYMSNYDIKRGTGYRFSLEKFIGKNTLVYKIDSEKIVYDTIDGGWTLQNYTERFIDGLDERIVKGEQKDTVLLLKPTDLYNVKESFEEMNLFELRDFIADSKMKGSDNVIGYEIEMHKRMASPVSIVILAFIGAALASHKSRDGMGIHLGIGITIAFSYIIFMEFSRVFALSGAISPVLAAWIPNIIFGIIGVYFLVKAPK